MAANKYFEQGSPLNVPVSAGIAASILTSLPIMVQGGNRAVGGKMRGLAGVINESATDAFGNVRPNVSVDVSGAFNLPVLAESAESPVINSAVQFGDQLYANQNTGTYDATTGLWYGFTIDKNQSGAPFGTALGAVPAGTTATIPVRLN